MKRFLILFTSIVFATVSCAGPSKLTWTKPDFRQDQFQNDHEDCVQAVKDDPEKKMTVEECLTRKGYESEPSSEKEKAKTAETMKKVGKVLLATGGIIVLGAAFIGLAGVMILTGI